VTALPDKFPAIELDLAVIREAVDNAIATPYEITASTY
jgi:hypothetical protein